MRAKLLFQSDTEICSIMYIKDDYIVFNDVSNVYFVKNGELVKKIGIPVPADTIVTISIPILDIREMKAYIISGSTRIEIPFRSLSSMKLITPLSVLQTKSLEFKGNLLKTYLNVYDLNKMELVEYRSAGGTYFLPWGYTILYPKNKIFTSYNPDYLYIVDSDIDKFKICDNWNFHKINYATSGENFFITSIAYFKDYIYTLCIDTTSDQYWRYIVTRQPILDLSQSTIIEEFIIYRNYYFILSGLTANDEYIAYVSFDRTENGYPVYRINISDDGFNWISFEFKPNTDLAIYDVLLYGRDLIISGTDSAGYTHTIAINIEEMNISDYLKIPEELTLTPICSFYGKLYLICRYSIYELEYDYQTKIDVKYEEVNTIIRRIPRLVITLTRNGQPLANQEIEILDDVYYNNKYTISGKVILKARTDARGVAKIDLTPFSGRKLYWAIRYRGLK